MLHIAPIGPSALPAIIGRHAKLPALHPADGERLADGHVYVAPPDHHLLVSDGRARIVLGPRENGNRPAAEPLFRSVAAAYGRRAAGVVLSGVLDDGPAGLVAIKRAGGTTIAQDRDEAAFPSMPANAVALADPDYVVPLHEAADVL